MNSAWRFVFAVLFLTLACSSGGGAAMLEFEAKWKTLISSNTAPEELERAEALAAFARTHSIRYRVFLSDPDTGKPIPFGDLDTTQTVPIVHLQLAHDARNSELTWEPRAKESIYPFLRE